MVDWLESESVLRRLDGYYRQLDRLLHQARASSCAGDAKNFCSAFRWVSYTARLNANAVERPWYGWCLYNAAAEAKALGYKAVTAVEMGVAGGNGLVCLCKHRVEIQKSLALKLY